jgi:rRNA maturation endonuclease Nob1
LLIFIFWIIGLRKKRKCPNCKKKVDKDMKICPYCGEHLKKKKDKD